MLFMDCANAGLPVFIPFNTVPANPVTTHDTTLGVAGSLFIKYKFELLTKKIFSP